ncbi:MAG: SMP-30/gluconolactonase/LRE family protein [Rubrivivax sp.]
MFCPDGTLVAGTRAGFQHIRLEEGQAHCKLLADPLAHDRRLMLNDGKCDRRGRYWCASVHSDFIGRAAELYRFDAPSGAVRIDGGFIIGNGIAFSPDDRHVPRRQPRRDRVGLRPRPRTRHARRQAPLLLDARHRRPRRRVPATAKATTGARWCTAPRWLHLAGGRLLERIAVPVKHPTMVAFGGPQLDTLYVTSAWYCSTPASAPGHRPARSFASTACVRGLPGTVRPFRRAFFAGRTPPSSSSPCPPS